MLLIGIAVLGLMLLFFMPAVVSSEQSCRARKIVFLAGRKSHGAGAHEYEKDLRLLKICLENSKNVGLLQIELHLEGWPEDPRTLNDADCIVMFSDGADQQETRHPLLVGDRLKIIEKQMDRGCGLVLQHYATIVPRRFESQFLKWVGGYFDYETGPSAGKNRWYSQIKTVTTMPKLGNPNHPIVRGIRPFRLREEYYYRIRFPKAFQGWTPILKTPIPDEKEPQVVAWAVQRSEGGRGFATTCGHWHSNFQLSDFRKLHLNAIVWCAGMEVPPGGVQSSVPAIWKFAEQSKTLDPDQEEAANNALRALIVTGEEYPSHKWQKTSLSLRRILWRDARFQVDITHDPEYLSRCKLKDYDVLVWNYCNWAHSGLSEKTRDAFLTYMKGGGGLCLIHFANGAFHFSLPNAPASDWPAWRRLCRRVWNHKVASGHDAYGRFLVEITDTKHQIVRDMKAFETQDELYFRQEGELPIQVLATARSRVTGKNEPMVWINPDGAGRVFQTVLGHCDESINNKGTSELILRGCLWAAEHR